MPIMKRVVSIIVFVAIMITSVVAFASSGTKTVNGVSYSWTAELIMRNAGAEGTVARGHATSIAVDTSNGLLVYHYTRAKYCNFLGIVWETKTTWGTGTVHAYTSEPVYAYGDHCVCEFGT